MAAAARYEALWPIPAAWHAYNSIPILGIILETLGTGAAHVVLLRPVCPVADRSSEATYCGNQELPQLLRRKDGRRVRTQLNSHTQPR
jgi:hypothetical protein